MVNVEHKSHTIRSQADKWFLGYLAITVFWLIAGGILYDCVPKSFAFMIASPIAFVLSILTLRVQEIHARICNYSGWSSESFASLCGMFGVVFIANMATATNELRTEIVKHKPDTIVHTPNTVVLFFGDDSRSSSNVSEYNSKSPAICQKRIWNWFNVQQTDKWYVCDGAVN